MNQSLQYELVEVMPEAQKTGLLRSSATFQQRTSTTSPGGIVDLNDWVNVSGLVAIPCMLTVYSPLRPDEAGVIRTPQTFNTLGERHLLLDGYYPAVLQQYTVTLSGDSARYEVMAVEHDSQHQQTRVAVRYYTQ